MGCLEGEAKRNIELILELCDLCDQVNSETLKWLRRSPPYLEPDVLPYVERVSKELDQFLKATAEGDSNE